MAAFEEQAVLIAKGTSQLLHLHKIIEVKRIGLTPLALVEWLNTNGDLYQTVVNNDNGETRHFFIGGM